MSVQGNNVFYGHFTSDGNPTIIEFPGPVNFYYQMNWTQWNSTANPGVLKRAWFHSTMPDASYLGVQNTNGAATDQSIRGTTGGFTPLDFENIPVFAPTAITAVTQANPAQITSNAHGLAVGDRCVLYNVTGMQQISGWLFEVRAIVDANNFTIQLDSSGFAAPGTGGQVRKVIGAFEFRPQMNYITSISQAASAVVRMAWATPSLNTPIGSLIRFRVSADSGMTEINDLIGEVTAINDTNATATVNIDTTGFTAFALPVSGTVYTQPHFVPVGEITSILAASMTNQAFEGLELGTAVVGASADEIKWVASMRELINVYH